MADIGNAIALLTFVTAQRLLEIVYARRNEIRLIAKGAVEHAPSHYWLIVALHVCWLAGLWLIAIGLPLSTLWLTAFLGLQLLRVWVLITLKERWTTRIIVLPGAPLITSGPYRFVRHPNYVIVAAELMILPLVFGLLEYGVVFTLTNAAILAIRIRAENQALSGPAASSLRVAREA